MKLIFADTGKWWKIGCCLVLIAGASMYSTREGPRHDVTMKEALTRPERYEVEEFVRAMRRIVAVNDTAIVFHDGGKGYPAYLPPAFQGHASALSPGMYASFKGTVEGKGLRVTEFRVHRGRKVKMVTSIIALAIAVVYGTWGYLTTIRLAGGGA